MAKSAALSVTLSWAALTKVVGRGVPFHNTTDDEINPEPIMMIVVAGLPGGRIRGEIDWIARPRFVTSNFTDEEEPPLGAGFVATTVASDAVARFAAGNVVVTWVALKKLVLSATPFQVIAVDGTNPLPFTVTGRSGEPTFALAGLKLVMAGTGLFTVKVIAPDVPPPGVGFSTVSFAATPLVKSEAGMVACRLVEETNVVVSAVPFH